MCIIKPEVQILNKESKVCFIQINVVHIISLHKTCTVGIELLNNLFILEFQAYVKQNLQE
jgi:hypothetical protein